MSSTMHFGPEWMRDKRMSKSRGGLPEPAAASTSATSYSSVLTPAPSAPPEDAQPNANPFKYSKEDILQVWKDGGGRAPLGLEVERWEGVVREVAGGPSGLKEMTDLERKLFSTNVNSELRRRGTISHDAPPSSSRPKLGHSASTTDALPRDRFGSLGRRRKDDANANDPPPAASRKLSVQIGSSSIAESTPAEPTDHGPSSAIDSAVDDNNPWSAKRTPADAFFRRATKSLATPTEPERELSQRAPQTLAANEHHDRDTLGFLGSLVSSLNINPPAPIGNIVSSPAIGAPPGLVYDPLTVKWWYIDPTNQPQGPFEAHTMQQWKDQGYFTPDLKMRRENIDNDFYPLAQFLTLATGEQFFLNHVLGPAAHSSAASHAIPNSLSDTAPLRGLRGHFGDHINAGVSPLTQSPASSFGRGYDARSSVSPDNMLRYGGDLDGYGMRTPLDAQNPFGLNPGSIPLNGVSPQPGFAQRSFSGRFQETQSPMDYRSPWPPVGGPEAGGVANNQSNGVAFSQPGARVVNAVDVGQLSFAPSSLDVNGQPNTMYSTGIPSRGTMTGHLETFQQSPGPNDIYHEAHSFSSNNSFTSQDPPVQSYASQEGYFHWQSQIINDPRFPADPNAQPLEDLSTQGGTANVDNVQNAEPVAWQAHYTQQTAPTEQEFVETRTEPPSDVIQPVQLHDEESSATIADEQKVASPVREVKPSEKKAKKAALEVDVQAPPKSAPADKSSQADAQSSRPQPKTAWSSFADSTRDAKAGKPTIGFRELQEEEKKEKESRKAKERQAKAAPDVPPPKADDTITIASWGLPTSQAGSAKPKEKDLALTPTTVAASTPTGTTSGAPWSSVAPVQAAKKSMREIQAEEEKQKNAIWTTEASTLPTTQIKRGYSDLATKVSQPVATAPAVAAAATSGWKTVGLNKVPQPIPVARTLTATPAAVAPLRKSPVLTTARPANAIKPSTHSPSLDFLKWLKESLKGLNAGVNVDDFIQMLLSFPVDASQDTIELIQEQAYANSTTLDGRRFAADFISRRKVDVSQPSSTQPSSGKAPSLAEVVKAPQKQAPSDWGYKVVKKKGRGNKAN